MVIEHHTTLARQVVDQVRRWIADGTLEHGTLYSVQQLSDRLQISRSPVREALLGLSEAGLVQIVRNRGFRVVIPSGRDVAQIFALRLALEPAASAAAAHRDGRSTAGGLDDCLSRMRDAALQGDEMSFSDIDRQLHAQIMHAAGNERAVQIVAGLREATRSLGASTAARSRSLSAIAVEHQPLVSAIRSQDLDAAYEAMRSHLLSTGRLLIEQAVLDGDGDARIAWRELVETEPPFSSAAWSNPG